MASKDSIVDVDQSPSLNSLTFQDIPHSERTVGVGDGDNVSVPSHTHTFTNFPNHPESDDEEDKANLLKGEKKPPSFWTFEYYQAFFDVDSYQVLRRILGSMLPNPKANYLQSSIRPNPDMYGPFWICTTLVFTTAIAGNLANYIQNSGKDYEWRYSFHKVTFAAAAIFSYWWVVPTMLWGLLWWRGSQAGYSFLEIICVYGYSLAIYIPISILWVVQYNWFQWLLVMLGMVLSGSVLLLVFWPAVRDDDKKIAYGTMALIILLHGMLAVGFVLYFFHVPEYSLPIPATSLSPVVSSATPNATHQMKQAISQAIGQSQSIVG